MRKGAIRNVLRTKDLLQSFFKHNRKCKKHFNRIGKSDLYMKSNPKIVISMLKTQLQS